MNKNIVRNIIVGLCAILVLGALMTFLRKQNEGVGFTGEDRQNLAYLRSKKDDVSKSTEDLTGLSIVLASMTTCNPAKSKEKSLSEVSKNRFVDGASIFIRGDESMIVQDIRRPVQSVDHIEVDGRIKSISGKTADNVRVTVTGSPRGLKKYIGDFKVGDEINFSGSVRFFQITAFGDCWLIIAVD